MSTIEDLYDELFGALKEEYDGHRQRIKQEELDKQKEVPPERSLTVSHSGGGEGTGLVPPAVRPPVPTRRGRKRAEEVQIQQWEIGQETNTTALAEQSVGAVAAHTFTVMDRTQSMIADEFYGVKRNEGMNELMRKFAAKVLSRADASLAALQESHLKRIAEDL